MDSEPRSRNRGVSARTLSSHGYAVCLFPEQPTQKVIVEQDRATEEKFKKVLIAKVEALASTPDLVRLHWRNRLIYLIAFVSYSLSLNNVYYFPINIYKYGESFFIPYTIATIFIGFPLHLLQTTMGQFTQRGSLWMWECAPLFCGVGLAMVGACILMSLYYNIFAAYSLVYFAHCFDRVLPWTYCNDVYWNVDTNCAPPTWHSWANLTSPAVEYFYNIVLNTPYRNPPANWDLDSLKWWLFLSLLFSWFVVYVATLRSARSIGKIAIFIVIFCYFSILVLVIVAIQVKGSSHIGTFRGTEHFCFDVLIVAVIQVLLELGICHGIPIVYGSFCCYRHPLHIDSLILCLINYLNSVVFYYLFFSLIGTFSCNASKLPWYIKEHNVGIIYIMYSQAFASISGSSLWCMLFFFMLFLIVIGTQIAITEAIMTAIYDNFVKLSKFRWIINLVVCGVFFVFGIIFCFGNGFYGAVLLHSIPILFTVVLLAFLFTFGFLFIYGLKQYSNDIKLMLDRNLNSILKILLYAFLVVLGLTLLINLFMSSTWFFNGVVFQNLHVFAAWFLCVLFIILPFVVCAVIWCAFCVLRRRKMADPSLTWSKMQQERQSEKVPFTKAYSSSYIWPWNKYKNV